MWPISAGSPADYPGIRASRELSKHSRTGELVGDTATYTLPKIGVSKPIAQTGPNKGSQSTTYGLRFVALRFGFRRRLKPCGHKASRVAQVAGVFIGSPCEPVLKLAAGKGWVQA